MTMHTIYENIIASFDALWHMKMHGKTMEVITPFSAVDSFISVFIKQQGNEYVVTDGGWINNQIYDIAVDPDRKNFDKLYKHYLYQYNIKTTFQKGTRFYYKKTSDECLVANLVYDLANFIALVVSASPVFHEAAEEEKNIKLFTREANAYLGSFIPAESIRHNAMVVKEYRAVRFNAVIHEAPTQLSLVDYITGSTESYFISSLTKALTNFNIVNSSNCREYVHKEVVVINNTAIGYTEDKLFPYLMEAERITGRPHVNWTEKEQLKTILLQSTG